MGPKPYSSFTYYFLNRRLHPQSPPGFRNDTVLLLVNKNATPNRAKFLFVHQKKDNHTSWGLPKEGMESQVVVDDVITSIARNLEEELGFKGTKVTETNPKFTQVAFLFNFATQIYDSDRSHYESSLGRQSKGKIYHLAVMDYTGPDILPGHVKKSIDRYSWADHAEGLELIKSTATTFNPGSSEFNLVLFTKILETYTYLLSLKTPQAQLF